MGRRNPHRAYERDGTMIRPPTVGEARDEGEATAAAICSACGHEAIVSTDGMPADLPFPDIALRLRCQCGSRAIEVRKDMVAHYRRLHERFGWSPR